MARGGESKGISRRTLLIGGGAGAGLIVAWALWPRAFEPNAGPGEHVLKAWLKSAMTAGLVAARRRLGQGQGPACPSSGYDSAPRGTVRVDPRRSARLCQSAVAQGWRRATLAGALFR